ncbi:MAG: GEVED domain-containing protein [Taibaiella sp.]|jgi:hypothetical protein
MNRQIYSLLLGCLLCVAYSARGQSIPQKDAELKAKAWQWHQETKNGFTQNKGQVYDQNGKVNRTVKYLLNMPGLNVQLRANSFSYDTWLAEKKPGKENRNPFDELAMPTEQASTKVQFHRVDIELEGANPNPELVVANALSGTDIVMDGASEIRDIHSYGKVTYKDIYPGIDLEFLAKKGRDKPVEYNFIVHPGADASQIKMHYKGADEIALKDGQIEMKLAFGTLKEKIPASFIEQTGQNLVVQYKSEASGLYAFNVPDYDKSKTLIIDPTPTLIWATYLGGAETATYDELCGVKVDNLGNVIVAGTTTATGLATVGSYQPTYLAPTGNGYLAKYTAAGVKTWATYIHGNGNCLVSTLIVDPSNNIYLSMWTASTNLQTSAGVHQTTLSGSSDGYIIKFTPAGAYAWGTYLGSTAADVPYTINVLNDGNIVVGGYAGAASTNIAFGTGFDQTFGGGGSDAFIVKLNATTGDGIWGTYIGGPDVGTENTLGLVSDNAGNIYFAANSASITGIPMPNAIQPTFGGGTIDAIIGRLNSTGSTLAWCTYYGGSGYDAAFEIRIGADSNLIVGGISSSPGMATTGAYQTTNAGGTYDAWISKFSRNGARIWATYYGGSNDDQVRSVCIDENNDIYIGGFTASTSGIATNCSYQPTYGGGTNDCFIAKINAAGTARIWGSYFGGANDDGNNGTSNDGDPLAYAGNGILYMAGYISSSGFATGGAADGTLTGTTDGFIAKFSEGFAPADVAVTPQTLSPMTQTACALGIPSIITGNLVSIYNPATFTSPIFYQWQMADDSTAGPWTDMPGEVFKDLTPLSGNTTKYYRRKVLVNDGFCDKKLVSTSAVTMVSVTSNVAPIANADGPQWFLCGSPNTVTLNGSATPAGSATISTYQWYAGSNLTTPAASIATFTPTNITSATTYTLKVTDNNGCTDVDQVTVTPVVANAGLDRSLCQGSGGVQIGTTGIAGGSVVYNWTILSGTAGSLSCTSCAQPIASPTAATTYRVTVTVTRKDNTTCTTTDDVVISFVATPTNGPAMAGTDKTICKSSTVVLGIGAADAAATYSWAPANYLSNPNIATPTFNAGIAMVSCPLTYTVTAVKNGCTFTDNIQVSVINPQVDYESDTTVCYLFSEQLNEPNCGNATYAWQTLSGPGVVQSTAAGGASANLYNPGTVPTQMQRVTTLNSVSCPSLPITLLPCGIGCPPTQIKLVGDKGCPKAFGGQEFQLYVKGINPTQWNYSWTPAALMDNPNAPVVTINATNPATVDVVITNIITGMVCPVDSLPINDPSWILPTINTPDRFICPGTPTGIGELGGGGYSYEWTPITGLTNPGLSNPLATLNEGISNYTVVKTDDMTGCIVTDEVIVTVNEIDYDAGENRSVCNGATVTLGSVPGGSYTYSWSPAGAAYTNGTTDTSAMPQVLFASVSQTFTVTVTDPLSGCTKTDTVTLSNSVTPGEYTGAAVGPLCPGTTAQIGKDAIPGASYLWSPATGLSCTTCANPMVTAGTANETYTLTVSYPGCSTPVTDQITVSVHPTPSVVFNGRTVCPATPVNIGVGGGGGNSASIAGVASYDWSPATGLSCLTCPSPLANPQAYTVYTATLVLTNGCILSDTVAITPSVTATAKPDATICPGSSVQLGSPSQAGVTYAWSTVSGSPVGTLSCTNCAQPIATPTVTTVYRLSATGNGCTITDDVQIIVKTLPAFTVAGNSSVCVGGTATLSVTPVAQNTIYQWSPVTGVASPTSPSTTIVPTATTTYKVTQTDLNSGCSDFKEVVVSVFPNNVSATGGAITICPQTQDTLPLTVSPASGNTISWSPATGLSNPFVQNPVLAPQASGTYTATVINNTTNCSDTALVTIVVPASCLGDDFGDAPLSYDAVAPASHNIVNTLKIGTSIDAEGAPVSSAMANGDDLNQVANDEAGISFLPRVNTASTSLGLSVSSVLNTTGSSAYLVAWTDFNRDGDFDDAGERSNIMTVPSSDTALSPVLQFSGFNTGCVVSAGPSYLRVRLTTDTSGGWNSNPSSEGNRANGEVEDYAITLMGADFGDAPVAYPAVRASVNPDLDGNGAPDAAGSVWLGDRVDYDYSCSYAPSAAADADDNDTASNDEDGLVMSTQIPIGVPVPWTITVNSQGPVTAAQWGMWIDWNADGVFDDFYTDSVNTASPTPVTVNVTAPASAIQGFIVRAGAKAPGTPFTLADYGSTITNGEWEDYIRATPLPVQLMYFNVDAKGCTADVSWATAMERSSDYFEIEQSTDGTSWKMVKRIEAAGSSSSVKKYSASLPLTSGINNYLRLKMVDEDGNGEYSMVRVLRCDNRLPVIIWPNPTTMKVQISGLPEGGSIRIMEVSGKEVIKVDQLAATETISIDALPAAVYQVIILNKNGQKIEVQQLVKKQ